MKKKLIALFAGALLTLAMAGNALAYFNSEYTLVRVVYDSAGTVEVATDLGTVSGSTVTLTNGGSSSAFNLSMFGTSASLDNLRVAYFAVANATTDVWASGSVTDAISTTVGRSFTALVTATATSRTYYTGLGGSTGTVVGDQGNQASYWNKLDKGGAGVATLAAYITSAGKIESSLADLATIGYVDQGLYFFDAAKTNSTGVKIATLRTLADGTTVLNPSSAVPVPAAVYLLGSGLLGLVGIRRRMS
jgi:hypothetical protein